MSTGVRKSHTGNNPREVIKARQKKVAEYFFLRNYTVDDISKMLGWTERTIWRDIGKIRETGYKQIKELDIRNILFKTVNTRNKVLQELWNAYDMSESVRDQVSTLGKIDDVESKNIKDLQELSIIPKPIERQEIVQKDYKFEVIIDGKSINRKKRIKNDPVEANTQTS